MNQINNRAGRSSEERKRVFPKEISSGLIIFKRGRKGLRYLLLYHGHGYWNFPKGKIEKEERSFEAAVRETTEETGLSGADLKIDKNFKAYERFTFYRNRRKIYKLVILYLAETEKDEIKVSSEHEGYGWFAFSEARKLLLKYQENLKILTRAHFYLKQKHSSPKATSGIEAKRN